MLDKRKVLAIFIVLVLSDSAKSQVFSEVKKYSARSTELGFCEIKEKTILLKNGAEYSTKNHRWTVDPGGDLGQFDSRVKAVCKAGVTPELIAKFKDKQKKDLEFLLRNK